MIRISGHINARAAQLAEQHAQLKAAHARAGHPLEVLTQAQVLERLQISKDTLFALREKGLPTLQLGARELRYVWPTVVAWLESHRAAPGAQSPPAKRPRAPKAQALPADRPLVSPATRQ